MLIIKRFYQWPSTINQIKKGLSSAVSSSTTSDGNGGNGQKIGDQVTINGWVKSVRHQKQFSFMEVGDGSSMQGLQVVGKPEHFNGIGNGTCVRVSGTLAQSLGKGQSIEIQLDEKIDAQVPQVKVLGVCPDAEYPLQPKQHSFEFLREIAHLRTRGNTLGAMLRVRNESSALIHRYFQDRQFHHVHTPLITSSDCEGGGEQFQVTLPNHKKNEKNESHFFGEPAFLTVSGQLEAEIFASSHSRVYTFGPSFRAEKSNTTRHLSEFWMVEPEMSFIQMSDNLDIAEDFVKSLIKSLLINCKDDMDFFNKFIDKDLFNRLKKTIDHKFIRLEYTEAVKLLIENKEKFMTPMEWGEDLSREHEKFLTSYFDNIPVFVINWPKHIKPFYMRVNDDTKTVANMDLLVPEVGELIGGSIREERHDLLLQRLLDDKMDQKTYSWYLDLRKYGSAPHGGFGLGFERFLQYVTGLSNIRDVIPIPRHQNYCKF